MSTPAEPPCAVAIASPRRRAGTIRIGISGWRYPPWRGVFYPKGLAQTRELAFASRALASVEINGSFYSLQTPESYAAWYAQTPRGFAPEVRAAPPDPQGTAASPDPQGTAAPPGPPGGH